MANRSTAMNDPNTKGRKCYGTPGNNGGHGQQAARNVLGEPLEICSTPMTVFYWDGCCDTGQEDVGSHTICAVMTCSVSRFFKNAWQRSFDLGAGTRFSWPEIRRLLVLMCASLAGGI